MAEENRWALVGARLIVAEGRVGRLEEHVEVPVSHLIVRKLEDRSDLLTTSRWPTSVASAPSVFRGRADEFRRPEPGSRRQPPAKLSPSKDFR